MTSFTIEDFKLGLDVRRSVLTSQPGSLQQLDSAVVTQGGEIQKRKAFVPVYTLPAGLTKGLYGNNAGAFGTPQLRVFSQGYAAPATVLLGNTSGVHPVPVYQTQCVLADNEAATTAPQAIYGVRQYGAGLFISAATWRNTFDPNTLILRNWWQGQPVTSYVGYDPLVVSQKMYRVANSTIYFSGVGDPSVTNPLNPAGTGPNTVNPGAGFIDTSTLDDASIWLVGMEAYYKQVAVFSRRVCLMFEFDADPTQNALQQVLRIGAISSGSILQFGTGDVLFLSDSGIRSLRVQNVSLAAGVTDVGSPIDAIIQAVIASQTYTYAGPQAIVEPTTGRYWLAINNVIYVLSYWPSARINAWSTFTLPFNVDEMTTAGTAVFVRSGDTIYQYGGSDGLTYDTSTCTVRTPLHAAETPLVKKRAVSLNAMVQGNWALSAGMDPGHPTTFELVANLTSNTFAMEQIPFAGYGSHIGFKLTTTDASPALLGMLACHYEKGREQ